MPVLRRVRVYEVWVRLREGFETSFGRTLERPALLVRVEERGGEEGWAEVVAGEGPWYSCETHETALHVIRDYLAHMLPAEVEARRVSEAFSRVRGHEMAKAGLEMAVWDLEARLAGKPLWRYIGGVRGRIESGVSVGIQRSVEELVRVVGRYLEQGYRRVKVKIKPGWDVEPLEALRREYPDTPLQADANAAYTLRDALHLKRLDRFNLLMLEQPLHWRDLVDHAELARILETPICLDESIKDAEDARRAYRLNAAWVINVKPGRVGGIMESLRIHDLWHGVFGRPLWIGGMLETGVGRGHLVALATLPGVKYPNDVSASDRYYEEDIVEPPWTLNRDGTITAPEKPGIGVEVLVDKVEAMARRVIEFKPEG
ncbi:o-succinylbenzoate synthase [Stetteria hydrogenophila]